jgi:hypothetical protein
VVESGNKSLSSKPPDNKKRETITYFERDGGAKRKTKHQDLSKDYGREIAAQGAEIKDKAIELQEI